VGGAGEVDEGEVPGVQVGLAAVLLDHDLTPGDHIDLAEIGVEPLDVAPSPVGPARPGRRELPDTDGAQIGGTHLVGHLVPVASSHLERPKGRAHNLADVLGASDHGNVVRPQHDTHGHIPSLVRPMVATARPLNISSAAGFAELATRSAEGR
jgi:hypothetical protein